jgi:hypothetical protein
MNRLHQILIGVLVVQLVLGVIVFWPRSAPETAGGPLLGDLTAEDIVALEISDENDISVSLGRTAGSGETGWSLTEADNYPVDGAKVTPLVDKLLAITQNRLIATTPSSHKRLQVAGNDFLRRIDIETANGKKQTVYLGSSAGLQTIHVRMDSMDEVYQATDISTWEFGTAPTSWIDPVYFSVTQADVTDMTLRNGNGEWRFSKDADGNWAMEGLTADETLNTSNVISLASQVGSVRMTRPLGKTEKPEYGMTEPSAVVTVEVKEGDQTVSYTLTVGAKDEEHSSYVVKSSASDYHVSVASATLDVLVQRTRDEFLQQPPTPASP